MKRVLIVVVSLVVLAGLFLAASRFYKGQRAEDVQTLAATHTQLFEPAHAMRLGNPDAKVVVVDFFDPACGTCAQFAPILEDMVNNSQGRIQVVERYAPFHPGSEHVAALLEAARRQDRYWDALHALFSTQKMWADHNDPHPERIFDILAQVGLDIDKLKADALDPAIRTIVEQDMMDARTLGVTQTPEFFVNGKPLPTWGLQQLKDLVASELKAQYGEG